MNEKEKDNFTFSSQKFSENLLQSVFILKLVAKKAHQEG